MEIVSGISKKENSVVDYNSIKSGKSGPDMANY